MRSNLHVFLLINCIFMVMWYIIKQMDNYTNKRSKEDMIYVEDVMISYKNIDRNYFEKYDTIPMQVHVNSHYEMIKSIPDLEVFY